MDSLKRNTVSEYIKNHHTRCMNNQLANPAKFIGNHTANIVITATTQCFVFPFGDELRVANPHNVPKYGISNIRISPLPTPELNYLTKLKLGGQLYELADLQTGGFWMTSELRSIPITKYHDIEIEFTGVEFNSSTLVSLHVSWDLYENSDQIQPIQPSKSDTPYEIIQSVNSFQQVTHTMGDESYTPYFALPSTNGMPLAKVSVRFLDGDNDALTAVWLFTDSNDNIHRLSKNAVTGIWELATPIDNQLFLPDDAKIQYSRLNGKQPPTRACVRLDTWNLTRVMSQMNGAMF